MSDSVYLEKEKFYYMEIWSLRKGKSNGHTSVGFISDKTNNDEKSNIP